MYALEMIFFHLVILKLVLQEKQVDFGKISLFCMSITQYRSKNEAKE